MNNILLINGHPDSKSFCRAICDSYRQGVQSSGCQIEEIRIADLEFCPNLAKGYRERTELEPDLLLCQKKIQSADHLVWVYPVWWGSVPAIMKGFLDRLLLPGFAFKKKKNSLWWTPFLTGKSAHLIFTMDQPSWYYKWINGEPSTKAMKKLTLNFIGIKKIQSTPIGPIRQSTSLYREKWLQKVERYGQKAGNAKPPKCSRSSKKNC